MDRQNSAPLDVVKFLSSHQRMIQAFAYTIVRDFHAAEDVYQEVAMIVVGQWPDVPGDEGLKPWLREVTRRKALETRRKSRRLKAVLPDELVDQIGAHIGAAEDDRGRDLRDVMAECVGELESAARKVVSARYGAGQSCEEIAGQIKRSVQSVYSILKRARLALAECVDRAAAVEG